MLFRDFATANLYNYSDILTIVTVDAGNSFITKYFLESLIKKGINARVLIVLCKENPYIKELEKYKQYLNIEFLENYDYQLLPYRFQDWEPSTRHSNMIKYVFSHDIIKTKYCIICDNDIVVKNNFSKLLNYFINQEKIVAGSIFYTNKTNLYNLKTQLLKYKILENPEIDTLLSINQMNIKFNKTNFIVNDRFIIYYRLEPQLILMNYENIRKIPNYLNYFASIKWGTKLGNYYVTYDTFAKFTKMLLDKDIPIYKIPNIYDYIKHFSGASFNKELTESDYKQIMKV